MTPTLRAAAAVAAITVITTLTACGASSSSSSSTSTAGSGGTAADAGAAAPKAVDACTLVTAADLSQAAGVTYSKIDSVNGGSLCNVTAASPTNSFSFHIDKEDGAMTTWDSEVATIKEDDGSASPASGIGDRAEQGAIKEFAAETKGYIVVIDGGDVNNTATAKDFTHSKAVAKLLVSKL